LAFLQDRYPWGPFHAGQKAKAPKRPPNFPDFSISRRTPQDNRKRKKKKKPTEERSQALAASFFCLGWAAAGGALNNTEYLENQSITKQLKPVLENGKSMLNAVRLAGAEWCQANDVPLEIFSETLCHIPPKKYPEKTVDGATLELMRSVFSEVKLAW